MTRYRPLVASMLAGSAILSASALAQGSLIKRSSLSAAPRFEQITFSENVLDGEGGRPIKSMQQISVPVGGIFGIGSSGWSVDIAGAFTSGQVQFDDGSTAQLSGISDVRVRASGRLLTDNIVLSIGANIPSGATSLDAEQLTAVRALAAPAFAMGMPALGFGPAGSVGVVGSRVLGTWIGALGVSYEYRGKFSPISALQAGADPDYDPGNVVHASAGLERFVGDNRLSIQGGADFYTEDVLTPAEGSVQRLQLGPVLSLDASLAMGGGGLRDGRIYGSVRRRAPFSRDGESVAGSDGIYINAGLEGGIPLGRVVDLHLGVDALTHSGLDVDNTLMTAKASAAAVFLGIRARSAGGMFEPFVRASAGSIQPNTQSVSFRGLSAGATIVLRF